MNFAFRILMSYFSQSEEELETASIYVQPLDKRRNNQTIMRYKLRIKHILSSNVMDKQINHRISIYLNCSVDYLCLIKLTNMYFNHNYKWITIVFCLI